LAPQLKVRDISVFQESIGEFHVFFLAQVANLERRAGRIEGSLFRTLAQNSRNVDERFMLPLEL
jgi:hypothetical protein